jgi:uncharacterized protein (DUF302 family)
MYEFNVEVAGSFDEAMTRVTEALAAEKLGVVSEVDVQAIVQNKLGKAIRPYRILGACAPGLALRVIEAAPNAGTLLPCNVVLREVADGKVAVSFMDPQAVFSLEPDAAVKAVGEEAHAILQRVVARLAGS